MIDTETQTQATDDPERTQYVTNLLSRLATSDDAVLEASPAELMLAFSVAINQAAANGVPEVLLGPVAMLALGVRRIVQILHDEGVYEDEALKYLD
jgi:hypothetical protein